MGQIVKNGAVADGSGQVAFAAKLDEFGFQVVNDVICSWMRWI